MRRLLIVAALASMLAGIGAALAFASTRSVALHDNYFSPRSVRIHRGSAVHWHWRTHNRHNVTAVRGARFHSRTGTNVSYTHVFNRRGTYTIICTRHPTQMRMTVRVIR
jgi:plastocyanin